MARYDEFLTDNPPEESEEIHNEAKQQSSTSTETDSSPSFVDLDTAAVQTDAVSSSDAAGSDGYDAGSNADNDYDTLTATLPLSLATRDQATALKPRYKGHSAFNNMVRRDWIKAIESNYSAFQALLYLPDMLDVGEVDDETGFEKPSFTELNNNQRLLTYDDADPVIVTVLDCPDERGSFEVIDADGEQDGLTDDVLILRIAAEGVPVGSILEWNEEMASGNLVRRWWYVHRIYGYGTQNVGSLYYCIPARNFDTTSNGKPE